MTQAANAGFAAQPSVSDGLVWAASQSRAARAEAMRRARERFITKTQNVTKPHALVILEYTIAAASLGTATYLYFAH
jgi:hypothetical protein